MVLPFSKYPCTSLGCYDGTKTMDVSNLQIFCVSNSRFLGSSTQTWRKRAYLDSYLGQGHRFLENYSNLAEDLKKWPFLLRMSGQRDMRRNENPTTSHYLPCMVSREKLEKRLTISRAFAIGTLCLVQLPNIRGHIFRNTAFFTSCIVYKWLGWQLWQGLIWIAWYLLRGQ